ncbi:MAG: RIP metalloprotease RseP [Gammaproteobacteria bacterium]|nr:RIP metalloprotease RseP [Gammaproteobacteria bacterium]
MTGIENLLYFIVALGILVTFHEFGHFWVARKLGVKVLTFSVGFGKPIWKRKGKDGVDYIIAMIPLGGYVKMLDERDPDQKVSEKDKAYAFNQKSVWSRIAIVAAGPLANFILAIGLYWWMFMVGITGLSTGMGNIDPESVVGRAGLVKADKIVSIDGQPVTFMSDITKAVAVRIGDKNILELEVVSEGNSHSKSIRVDLADWQVDTEQMDLLDSMGFRHKIDDLVVLPKLYRVESGSPADLGGLKAQDLIVQFEEHQVNSWQRLVELIESNAKNKIDLLIERNGELNNISVVIGTRQDDESKGYLGAEPIRPARDEYFAVKKESVLSSFNLALNETSKMIALSAGLFKKLITGDISPKSLSGPISIAKGAGDTGRAGLVYFLSFLALISVNLGFINLLPVPLLDGGHLLYFSYEAVTGKPLSEKVQELGMQIGMLIVFALMAMAIMNDISRL